MRIACVRWSRAVPAWVLAWALALLSSGLDCGPALAAAADGRGGKPVAPPVLPAVAVPAPPRLGDAGLAPEADAAAVFRGAAAFGGVEEAIAPAQASVPGAPALATAEMLAELAARPPQAVFFDYDATLSDHGPDGLTQPPSQAVIDGLIKLLKAGVPVGIVTARSFDYSPPGTKSEQWTLWEPLVSRIPAELRSRLFFSGRMGGELVLFDAAGGVRRVVDDDWTEHERATISDGIDAALAGAGASRGQVEVHDLGGHTSVIFKPGDPRAAPFARALVEEFKRRGLLYRVIHSGDWTYFSKYDKGDGGRLIVAALRALGRDVRPEGLVYVADQLNMPAGHLPGGDVALALAFPQARIFSVGPEGQTLPPNARHLGIVGSRGSLRIIDAVLAGRSAAPSPAAKTPFWARPEARLLAATAFGAAVGVSATHGALAAAVNTALLTGIGIPQIIRNFRHRGEATKDLALGQSLIWFPAAVLLSAASILNHSSAWFVASNLAGVAESLTLNLQINGYTPRPGSWRKSLTSYAAALIPTGLAAAFLPAKLAASAAFAAAMVLLFFIDFPQILKNFELYKAEMRPPTGLDLFFPLLIWTGTIFGVIAAVAFGDWFWALNSVMAGAMISIVLGQKLAPLAAATNRAIGPAVEAYRKALAALKKVRRME